MRLRNFSSAVRASPASSYSPSGPRRRRGSPRPSRCGWSSPAGWVGGNGNAGHDLGREPDKFSLHCRRTATASLFLGRNRTSDSTRIPVWISLLKPGSVDRSLPGCPTGRECLWHFVCDRGTVLGSPGRSLDWQDIPTRWSDIVSIVRSCAYAFRRRERPSR
jgi:hypothetical protein